MRRTRHFRSVAAIFVALAIHAAAVAGALMKVPPPDAAADPGTGGVMLLVATAAAGSSAGQQKPEPEISPDTASQETPAETVPPEKPAPKFNLEKLPKAEPVVQAIPVEKTIPPRPKPVPIPKRKPVRTQQVAAVPMPQPATPNRLPEPVTAAPPLLESSASTSGDQGVSRQTQIARSGGGDVKAYGNYFAVVRDWLHDHKRYPRRARVRMITGEALVGFLLDPSGRVVSYELRKSTGHDVLDREVLAMIRRASPMPPFPPGLRREKMNFNVPVNFGMR